MDEKPKLRMLEATKMKMQDTDVFCLRDPEKLTQSTVVITPLGAYFVQLMDGNHTLPDIQADYKERFGDTVPGDEIQGLIRQLDDCYFLDNERYRQKQRDVLEEYELSDVRPCSHAGYGYPGDAEELGKMLDGFYATAAADQDVKRTGVEKVRGIMAPHIDVRHGGPCFATAYEYLRDMRTDLFVILGVGHEPSKNLFTVVDRDFETPLGRVPVDRAALDVMKERLGGAVFEEGFQHRMEHSIEFQVIFLQHLWGGGEPVPILPVLCTSFHEMLLSGREPSESEEVKGFLSALEEAAGGRDVCYIAGVDLAHVGLKFGDPEPPGREQCNFIRNEDMALLNHAEDVDASAFFKTIAKDHDARRICGFPAMYVFLKVVDATRGHVLKYEQLMDHQSGSMVSYAGMVFE